MRRDDGQHMRLVMDRSITCRPSRFAPRAAAVFACLPVILWAANAVAQGATETSAARAERLFHEGKTALEAHRLTEACPKLAESQQLDPGTGTLLALALCHEGTGATASAWREFKEVVAASAKRPDRATMAQRKVQALEPTLSTVTISIPEESRSHADVRMDGDAVASAVWAGPFPADPGDHVIEAQVPGGIPWKGTVHLGPNHDAQVVRVPTLEPAAAATPAVSASAPPTPMGTRHKVGWIVGGSGAAALVVGGVFGGLALSQRSSATSLCPSSPCSSATGVSDNNAAKASAWVADVGIGLGIAAVGTAAYLLLTHDDARPAAQAAWSPRVVPSAAPGGGGVAVVGRW